MCLVPQGPSPSGAPQCVHQLARCVPRNQNKHRERDPGSWEPANARSVAWEGRVWQFSYLPWLLLLLRNSNGKFIGKLIFQRVRFSSPPPSLPPPPSLRIHYLLSRDGTREKGGLRRFKSLMSFQGTLLLAANGLVRRTVITTTLGSPPDSTPSRSLSLRACAIQAATCMPRPPREYIPPTNTHWKLDGSLNRGEEGGE